MSVQGTGPSGRTLLVLSSGDWESSVERRNAHRRLEASAALAVFDRVEYLFFRVEMARVLHPAPWLRVREISGRGRGLPGPLGRLSAFGSGALEILRSARAARPDAILATDPFLSGILGLGLRATLGVPLAVGVLSDYRLSARAAGLAPPGPFPEWLAFQIQDRVISSADLVLCDREYYARYARACGARAERVHVHPMWAEDSFYHTRADPGLLERLGVRGADPLVYVGRLSPEKYSDDLLRAWLRIRASDPGRELIVVGGSGPERVRFERTAEEAGAAGDLHIVWASASEVGALLSMAGAVLAPHAGYTLVEAALSAARMVAYDFEGHPELIEDGITGRLVPYRDWRAMADAALELLRDPTEATRMGGALQRRALAEHRQERVVASVNQAFQGLLDRWHP